MIVISGLREFMKNGSQKNSYRLCTDTVSFLNLFCLGGWWSLCKNVFSHSCKVSEQLVSENFEQQNAKPFIADKLVVSDNKRCNPTVYGTSSIRTITSRYCGGPLANDHVLKQMVDIMILFLFRAAGSVNSVICFGRLG